MTKKEIKENELLLISYMAGGDAMKKHFESRKCSNCKYRSEVHPSQCAHEGNYTFDWLEIPSDFSCNKWENKSV